MQNLKRRSNNGEKGRLISCTQKFPDILISKEIFTIGFIECDGIIHHDLICREHCVIKKSRSVMEPQWKIESTGPRGMSINGKELRQFSSSKLELGDKIRFSDEDELEFLFAVAVPESAGNPKKLRAVRSSGDDTELRNAYKQRERAYFEQLQKKIGEAQETVKLLTLKIEAVKSAADIEEEELKGNEEEYRLLQEQILTLKKKLKSWNKQKRLKKLRDWLIFSSKREKEEKNWREITRN